MSLSDETLMAYADGELSGEEARRVEAELKTRPELAATVEKQRQLRRQLDAAFAQPLHEDVPERLLRAVQDAPVSWQWRLMQFRRRIASRGFVLRTAVPVGAALACGLLLGIWLTPSGVLRVENGNMVASGPLATALERQLASEQVPGGHIRVGMSFKSKDGRYCRTFARAEGTSSLDGVACRDANGWSVAAVSTTTHEEGVAAYQMAESTMPDAIRNTVKAMMQGDPLGADAERKARDQAWKSR